MVSVNEIQSKDTWTNYIRFYEIVHDPYNNELQVILLVGSPTKKEISWCPPCRKIHPVFYQSAKNYPGNVDVYIIPVGKKEEWRPPGFPKLNPFQLIDPPMAPSVPTTVVYKRSENEPPEELLKRVSPDVDFIVDLFGKTLPAMESQLK